MWVRDWVQEYIAKELLKDYWRGVVYRNMGEGLYDSTRQYSILTEAILGLTRI